MVEQNSEPHKRSSYRVSEFDKRHDLQCNPSQLPILDSASGLLQVGYHADPVDYEFIS
jgi:hypothetical protein